VNGRAARLQVSERSQLNGLTLSNRGRDIRRASRFDRRAVLISRNPMNGQSIVIERDIEKLVRGANRDALNPFLMPGDAIACYDSRWTNFREAVGLVTDAVNTVTPAILLDNAL